jgi:hypothetical protein
MLKHVKCDLYLEGSVCGGDSETCYDFSQFSQVNAETFPEIPYDALYPFLPT